LGLALGSGYPARDEIQGRARSSTNPYRSVSAIEGKTTVTETERMREQMGTPEKPAKSLV